MPIIIPRYEKPKQLKYSNRITVVDGIRFHSKKEADRYGELTYMQKAGEIKHLELQKSFELKVNGVKIGNYRADFYYLDTQNHEWVVEDVKGFHTHVYRIKKKLMLAVHGVRIREV